MRVVFVTGCPKSGKTTVARAISREFGLTLCSPGEWLRDVRDTDTPLGRYISHNYNYHCLDPIVTDFVAVKVKQALFELGECRSREPLAASLTPH
jgi:adenylate kinase family enzyme